MTPPHNNHVPVLTSERLTLRAHRREDFADSLLMWSDPQVNRFIGGQTFNSEEVWARLLRYVGHWQILGYGFWLIEEKASGQFVGEVGFADFKRIVVPSFEGMPEIGWALATSGQGRGLASEAVAAVVAWGDRHFGRQVTTGCLINPDNAASIRVAQKSGYQEFCRTLYKDAPALIFRR